jgi:hypothetical protein
MHAPLRTLAVLVAASWPLVVSIALHAGMLVVGERFAEDDESAVADSSFPMCCFCGQPPPDVDDREDPDDAGPHPALTREQAIAAARETSLFFTALPTLNPLPPDRMRISWPAGAILASEGVATEIVPPVWPDEGAFSASPPDERTYAIRIHGPEAQIDRGTVLDLDRAIVRRELQHAWPRLALCYRSAQVARPGLAGVLAIQLAIVPGRRTIAVAGGIDDDELARCAATVVESIVFPPGAGTGQALFRWQLHPR